MKAPGGILLLRLCIALSLANSCILPPDFEDSADSCEPAIENGLLVLNEGTFGNNEARLDYLREGDDSISCSSVFFKKNNQRLGDVGQAMLREGDRLYVLVNNSHLIHELEFPSLLLLRSLALPGGSRSSPRSAAFVSTRTMMVTSLLDSGVYLIDKSSFQVRKKLVLGNYPEGLALFENKAFISLGNYVGTSEPRIAILDMDAESLLETKKLPLANPGAVASYNGNIWIACRGDFLTTEKKAGLIRMNGNTHAIDEVISMGGNLQNELQTGGGYLFALRDSSIARLNLETLTLEEDWIRREDLTGNEFEYPYSLSLDQEKGFLYVGVAHGLGANGSLVVVNPFGQVERRIPAGRFPGQILFWDE